MQTNSSIVEKMAAAITARQPLPAMHCESLAAGYQLQQELTQHMNGREPSDLKAGVTGAVVQKHLGLDGPLIASLYPRGKLSNGAELSLVQGQELECEIGVVVNGEGQPIGLVPVVEVVYLAFSQQEDFSIANIVAANLAADRYICGEIQPWDPSLEDLTITASQNSTEIATLSNDYSFGSPASGAQWLVGEAKERGIWQAGEVDRLLILGTCGTPLPGATGNYSIDFGVLGQLEFTIL
ncbi:hypothetical protein [Marinobacter alexandrii]|uniref:hypothetical protein n=1 Tax=Marinobacter alexandrii TaxID=2570351 RepID=UPI0032984B22